MTFEDLKTKVKSGKLTYPAITVAFAGIVLIFFIMTSNFITRSIKASLDLDYQSIESRLLKFDRENYLFVAKRLGIDTQVIEEAPKTPRDAEPQPQEPALLPEEKSLIKISILNSTKTSGLASTLEKELETAGFAISNTSNQATIEQTTIIRLKQSASLAFPKSIEELKEIVDRTYEIGTGSTIPESEDYDIIVIIGAK